MERTMEDLEVDLRIANARAEVAIGLVRTLVRELSGIVSWNEDDLFRSYLDSFDDEDPARDYACLDFVRFHGGDDGVNPGEAYGADLRRREVLDHKIRKQIRQDRASSI
jgi:hypothetical protein